MTGLALSKQSFLAQSMALGRGRATAESDRCTGRATAPEVEERGDDAERARTSSPRTSRRRTTTCYCLMARTATSMAMGPAGPGGERWGRAPPPLLKAERMRRGTGRYGGRRAGRGWGRALSGEGACRPGRLREMAREERGAVPPPPAKI